MHTHQRTKRPSTILSFSNPNTRFKTAVNLSPQASPSSPRDRPIRPHEDGPLLRDLALVEPAEERVLVILALADTVLRDLHARRLARRQIPTAFLLPPMPVRSVNLPCLPRSLVGIIGARLIGTPSQVGVRNSGNPGTCSRDGGVFFSCSVADGGGSAVSLRLGRRPRTGTRTAGSSHRPSRACRSSSRLGLEWLCGRRFDALRILFGLGVNVAFTFTVGIE